MSVTIKTKYLGELRTHSTHLKSGNTLITDAPVDNNGKGEAFSPTDLLATSLATCMLTIMGMAAQQHGFSIDGMECDVTKVMAANPRRVAEVKVAFGFSGMEFSQEQLAVLKEAAESCPVAVSLGDGVRKSLVWG